MKTPTVRTNGKSTRVTTTSMSGCASAASSPWRISERRRAAAPFRAPVQEGVDRERRDAEHDDLAEGVEAAEVDQDYVDDVGAASSRLRLSQVVFGDRCEVARHHREGERADAAARDHGNRPVPRASDDAGLGRRHARQEVEGKQQEDRCHDLDRDLGEREVGRGKLDEGERDAEAHDAGQDEGEEAVRVRQNDSETGHREGGPDHERGQVHGQQGSRAVGVLA
jgi:hypothetical protein